MYKFFIYIEINLNNSVKEEIPIGADFYTGLTNCIVWNQQVTYYSAFSTFNNPIWSGAYERAWRDHRISVY